MGKDIFVTNASFVTNIVDFDDYSTLDRDKTIVQKFEILEINHYYDIAIARLITNREVSPLFFMPKKIQVND